MLNREQIDGYIRGAKEVGISPENIRDGLFSQGATLEQISEGFVRLGLATEPPKKEIEIESKLSPNIFKNPMNTVISSTPSPQIQTPPPIKIHKNGKFGKVLVSFFVFLLLVAGGAYAYVGFVVPPNSVTEKAFIKITKIKSMSFDTMVTMGDNEGMPEEFKDAGNKIIYSGSYNFHDEENKTALFNLSFSFQGIAGALEARLIGDKVYGKLLKAPDFFLLSNLEKYENKWYYMTLDKDFKEDTLAPSVGSVFSGETFIEEELTQEQKDKIATMFKDARFIVITKKELPTLKDGMLMHHIMFEPDYEGILNYFRNIFEFIKSERGEDLGEFDMDSFESDFRESIKAINNFQGDMWVNVIDGLPYKVTTSFNVSYPDIGMSSTNITIESNFKDWNQDIQIQTPEGAIDYKEVSGNDYGFGLGGAREKGKDATIKSELSSLRAVAEIYYVSKNSYVGFCNSDEFIDARERIMSLDRLLECSSGQKGSDSFYSVSSILGDGTRFCVDSTGFADISSSSATGTECIPVNTRIDF